MKEHLLGTVKTIKSTGLSILIDGETEATKKDYLFLGSYIPKVNDRVLIARIGSSYVVLGNVSSITRK